MKGIATSEPDLAQQRPQTSGSRFLRGIIIRRWKDGHKKTRIRINNIPSEIRKKEARAFLRASSTRRTAKRRSGNKTVGGGRGGGPASKVETRVTQRGTQGCT